MKRAIVIADTHFPNHNQAAMEIVYEAIRIVQPEIIVHLGDLGDWESVSSWQWKSRKRPPVEYQLPVIDDEIKVINDKFDELEEVLDEVGVEERYLIQGNHDQRLDRFVEEHPYLPQYKYYNAIHVEDRDWEYYPMTEMMSIGNLYFYHGHYYGNAYHAAKHLRELGVNVMYGDRHQEQMHLQANVEGPIGAWCIGALIDLEVPKHSYLRGRPINWMNAFAIVDFFEDGNFSVDTRRIINGRTSVWGHKIERFKHETE